MFKTDQKVPKKGEAVLQIFLLEDISHADWSMTFNGECPPPTKVISISKHSYLNYLDRRRPQNKKYPARGKLL